MTQPLDQPLTMRPPRQVSVDECGRITLPWSPAIRPGDKYRVYKLGQGGWKLKLVHAESLAAPKFKRVLRVLKDRSRDDIHFRQYIRHWLCVFRADRGSFTGRIVFRHAALAKRELFQPPTLFEYSEDYYRGRLVSPRWVQRAIDEAMQGEESPFSAAELRRSFKRGMQRGRAEAKRWKKLADMARKAGVQGVGLKMRWHPIMPLGIWFKLE
jgi:hypothetical protein